MSITTGLPSASEWRRHQTYPAAQTSTAEGSRTLFNGATCANGVALTTRVPVAGATAVRVRFKASVGGTLALSLLRPDGVTAYTVGNPTNVTAVADTETKIETNELMGEAWALVTYTPSGAGTVTFLDTMAL